MNALKTEYFLSIIGTFTNSTLGKILDNYSVYFVIVYMLLPKVYPAFSTAPQSKE